MNLAPLNITSTLKQHDTDKLYDKFLHRKIIYEHTKVGHSSNFLYQGFAEKYFLGIYLHGKAYNQKENWGVSVHLIEQW